MARAGIATGLADQRLDIAHKTHRRGDGILDINPQFGRLPCLSDFYGLLEAIGGMDHIENLRMTLRAVTPGGVQVDEPRIVSEDRPLDVEVPVYTLVYSGEHKFNVKALA